MAYAPTNTWVKTSTYLSPRTPADDVLLDKDSALSWRDNNGSGSIDCAFSRLAADVMGVTTGDALRVGRYAEVESGAAAVTPGTGYGRIYEKSADKKLYFLNEDGTEYDLTAGGAGGGYAEVQEEGAAVTARTKLNVVGTALTVTDDGANSRTQLATAVIINTLASLANAAGYLKNDGAGALSYATPPAYATVQEEGAGVAQRAILNFQGSALTAADDSINSRTNVTVTAIINTLASLANAAGVLANDGSGNLSYVDHGGVTGLTDDDHAQYALLVGRSGGQTLQGDTAASGLLTLDGTAHATKGGVQLAEGNHLRIIGQAIAPTATTKPGKIWYDQSQFTLKGNFGNKTDDTGYAYSWSGVVATLAADTNAPINATTTVLSWTSPASANSVWAVGKILRFTLWGYYTTPASPATVTWIIKAGSTTICTTAATALTGSMTGKRWELRADVGVSAAGTVWGIGSVDVGVTAVASQLHIPMVNANPPTGVAVTLTNSQTWTVQITVSNTASNVVHANIGSIEILN